MEWQELKDFNNITKIESRPHHPRLIDITSTVMIIEKDDNYRIFLEDGTCIFCDDENTIRKIIEIFKLNSIHTDNRIIWTIKENIKTINSTASGVTIWFKTPSTVAELSHEDFEELKERLGLELKFF